MINQTEGYLLLRLDVIFHLEQQGNTFKMAIFESAVPNCWTHSSACGYTKSFFLAGFFCEFSPRGIHAASDARQFFCTSSLQNHA